MKLVIGGYAQGKLHYVMQKYGQKSGIVWDGAIPDEEGAGRQECATDRHKQAGSMADCRTVPVVFNHFHIWVRNGIANGGCPEEEAQALLEKYPDIIIISDEIGNGIVPMDAFERECRERTGRILVELASRATEVERVICGIGQRIK